MHPRGSLSGGWKRRGSIAKAGLVLTFAALLVGLLGTAASAVLGDITEFAIPTPASQPNGIAAGPDGNLWFTEFGGSANKVASITTGGAITEYSLPTPGAGPRGIASGGGSSVYFTEWTANKIGRINTGTGVVTEFAIPTAASQPDGIVLGPDGNLWFTESAGNKIGKLLPGSGTVLEFAIPTANSQPSAITAGPDGNLWFVENNGNKIGRVTTAGVFTEFVIPTANSQPNGIVAGSDGNLWFTENNTDKIARVTPAGVFTEYALAAGSAPTGITAGADGNLWFNEAGTNKVARATTAGVVTEFAIPTASSVATGIASGADMNLWFTEYGTNRIGRLEAAANLTVSTVGIAGGTGTVTSAPAGINCGATCSARYMDGTSITLTAVADPGSRFVGFTGGCVGASPCTFTFNGDTTVTATFQKTWNLNVTNTGIAGGTGTVTSAPGTINCTTPTAGVCTNTFDDGTGVTLTATADPGSRFAGWSGDCAGVGPCNLTMSVDRTATATFQKTWDLTVSATNNGPAGGSVTSDVGTINCPGTCVNTYDAGTVVNLTANTPAGSVFNGWGGDCAGVGACSVTMTANRNVSATFTKQWNLNVTNTGIAGGTGTVTSAPGTINCTTPTAGVCTNTFDDGTGVTLTATADPGSRFAGWSGDCAGTGACNLTMTANMNVTATFQKTWNLSVTNTGIAGGTGTVTSAPGTINCTTPTAGVCTNTFDDGTGVTLTATADPGSRFAGWSGDCAGVGPCNLTMSVDRTVTATFQKTYDLTATKSGTGGGTITSAPAGIDCGATCTATFDAGTAITLTGIPDATSTFTGWGAPCAGNGPCSFTLNSDMTVNADFARVRHVLTVVKTGAGSGTVTSSPSGINCGVTCAASFDTGTVVTLTATADATSVFAGWGGDCAGMTCVVTLGVDRNVTAQFDGAAPAFQPDGLIRNHGGGSFVGENIYNLTGAGQTATTRAPVGTTMTFDVRVQNDGNTVDSFMIMGPGSGGGAKVKYFDGSGDITAAVVAGTYTTPEIDSQLGPDTGRPDFWTIKVKITGKNAGPHVALVTSSSVADGSKEDAVKAKLKST